MPRIFCYLSIPLNLSPSLSSLAHGSRFHLFSPHTNVVTFNGENYYHQQSDEVIRMNRQQQQQQQHNKQMEYLSIVAFMTIHRKRVRECFITIVHSRRDRHEICCCFKLADLSWLNLANLGRFRLRSRFIDTWVRVRVSSTYKSVVNVSDFSGPIDYKYGQIDPGNYFFDKITTKIGYSTSDQPT